MRLVMTLLVRDEEDIVGWNLRYHLSRGVDHVIVTDNRSTDRTPEIVREFEEAGRATYLFEPADDYSQDLWVSRMARMAQEEEGADWIIHSDADEFWWPERAASLKDALAALPPEVRAVSVARSNFLGPSHEDDRDFFSRMIYRQARSQNFLGRPLLPKVAHRVLDDPHVLQGNHGVSEQGQPVAAADFDGVTILHFPARSPDQLRNKIAKGGAAYARNTRLNPRFGLAWRALYPHLLDDTFDQAVEKYFCPGKVEGAGEALVEDHRLRVYLTRL